MANTAMICGAITILAGLWCILTRKDIIRMIIGFTIFEVGINIVIVSVGYFRGKTAPIIDNAVPLQDIAAKAIDPVPQALVLTAIVIGLAVTALMLTFAYKIYLRKGTLQINEIEDLKW